MSLAEFQAVVWDYYDQHQRNLPWRKTDDPYKIMVSEIMLQQTQVNRVIIKYAEFLKAFPSISVLATTQLNEVLRLWSGLGYNRRAKFLHEAAKKLQNDFGGHVPKTPEDLMSLPGIGKNTAGAILAYAYNQPVVFIETNIRTVYLHHFFKDKSEVSDAEIIPVLEQTIDQKNPREFYWALMDYGTYLKSTIGNVSKNSKHYVRQSKFEGSLRQVRGQVLKLLGVKDMTMAQILDSIPDDRVEKVLTDLEKEQMITKRGQSYHLG